MAGCLIKRKQFGKKGIFLTFIAISLIAAFILVFLPSNISLKKDIPAVKTRVTTINAYVTDLEDVYLEKSLQASSTKTITALIKYMQSQNQFLADFDGSFREVLLKGTISGQPIDNFIEPNIMAGNTYPDWLGKMKTTADAAFNINTNFNNINVNDIKVYQTSPWILTVDATVSFTVSSETASWSKTVSVRSEIDIQDFNDPYYLVNTAGAYTNRIKKSSVSFDEWDIGKAKEHIRQGTYVHFEGSKAPNFIMRFTNTIAQSSCCGIESLVNPNKPGITNKDVSYADYKYWSSTPACPNSDLYTIDGISNGEFPNFKLDLDHVVKYNLRSSAALKCPPP